MTSGEHTDQNLVEPIEPFNNRGDKAHANQESLQRIFTIPETDESTLAQIDLAITNNLDGFLAEHIVAIEQDLSEIETHFASADIPEQPFYVSSYTDFVLEKLVSQSVHTSAPGFVGHMTSALPYFMLPLSKIVTALNKLTKNVINTIFDSFPSYYTFFQLLGGYTIQNFSK